MDNNNLINNILQNFEFFLALLDSKDKKYLNNELAKIMPTNEAKVELKTGWGHFQNDATINIGIGFIVNPLLTLFNKEGEFIEEVQNNEIPSEIGKKLEIILNSINTDDLILMDKGLDILKKQGKPPIEIRNTPAMIIAPKTGAFHFSFILQSTKL